MNERRYAGDGEHFRSDQRRQRLPMDRILKLTFAGLDGGEVLDVGCGTGFWSEEFARLGYEVAGADVNPEMVGKTCANVPGGEFVQAPMETLPFDDDRFDIAFLGFVLHEADDYVKALSEARRVSRLRTVVVDWAAKPTDHGPPLDHRLTEAQVQQFADQAGFGKVNVTDLGDVMLFRLSG